ncbi:MAG: ABC transporter substrate-binding protein [Herminiimonas sp.]|nr:ABC transporter substrate-binding protein [Herminiimonas sp.]
MKKSLLTRIPILTALLLAAALGAWAWFANADIRKHPGGATVKVTIALPTQISAGSIFVAQSQKYFARRGIEATIQPFALGKDALASVLKGNADLAVLADTPFMLAVMKGEKIAAVTTVFSSRTAIAVVGRKDRGIAKAEDLAGKRVGTISGTNAQYFLDALLLSTGVDKSTLEINDVRPDAMAEALQTNRVDAVTAWNPELARLEAEGQGRYAMIYGSDAFVYRFVLVGKQDYISRHAEEVRNVLRAIGDAVQFIQTDEAAAKVIISNAISLKTDLLSRSFDPKDYFLTLDQALLLSLSEQSRWAVDAGFVQSKTLPNYLEYIRYQALESVLPSAVKIIR